MDPLEVSYEQCEDPVEYLDLGGIRRKKKATLITVGAYHHGEVWKFIRT